MMVQSVVLAFLSLFSSIGVAADAVPHKIVPTVKPEQVLKPGDKVDISVKIKNPKSLTDLVRFHFAGAVTPLKLDEKTGSLVGEFVVPKVSSKEDSDSRFEIYGHGDVTFVRGATEAEREQYLKDVAKASEGEEKRINYFNFYTPLNVEALPQDDDAPKVSNVEIKKIDATHVKVSFDSEDEAGLGAAAFMVHSRWNEDKARGIEAGKHFFFAEQTDCESEKSKYTCSMEFELPETIFGEPILGIDVWDGVGNQAVYSSVDGDFKFEWKSRPVVATDLVVPELVDAEVVEQKGRSVRLILKNTGAPIAQALPGITQFAADGAQSSMQSYGDHAVLKNQKADSVEAQFELPEMTPELEKGHTFGIGFFLYSANGESDSYRLPDSAMKKIDLKAIPPRPVGADGVPEIESVTFKLK
jgi:hypothetical protein